MRIGNWLPPRLGNLVKDELGANILKRHVSNWLIRQVAKLAMGIGAFATWRLGSSKPCFPFALLSVWLVDATTLDPFHIETKARRPRPRAVPPRSAPRAQRSFRLRLSDRRPALRPRRQG